MGLPSSGGDLEYALYWRLPDHGPTQDHRVQRQHGHYPEGLQAVGGHIEGWEDRRPCVRAYVIELETERRDIRLPGWKLEELKSLIGRWKTKKACRKRELLSLVGELSHACKVVHVGQTFLRRMINLSTKARHPDHWIKLDAEFHADLSWWDVFLPVWNARSMMDIHDPNWVPTVSFSSDASGSWDCGAVWQQAWLQHPWDEEWKPLNIAAKELVPIAVACAVWGRTGAISACWFTVTTWQWSR